MSALSGADLSQPGDLSKGFGDYLQVWIKKEAKLMVHIHDDTFIFTAVKLGNTGQEITFKSQMVLQRKQSLSMRVKETDKS